MYGFGVPAMGQGQALRAQPGPMAQNALSMDPTMMRRAVRSEMQERGMPTWGQDGFSWADRRAVKQDVLSDFDAMPRRQQAQYAAQPQMPGWAGGMGWANAVGRAPQQNALSRMPAMGQYLGGMFGGFR